MIYHIHNFSTTNLTNRSKNETNTNNHPRNNQTFGNNGNNDTRAINNLGALKSTRPSLKRTRPGDILMGDYIFSVTSKITGHTIELDYYQFTKWHDRLWNKLQAMESYYISGIAR